FQNKIPVDGAGVILHIKENRVYSINISICKGIQVEKNQLMDAQMAGQNALQAICTSFIEQTPVALSTNMIKGEPVLMYYPVNDSLRAQDFKLVYEVTFQSHTPELHSKVYINAVTGQIEGTEEQICSIN